MAVTVESFQGQVRFAAFVDVDEEVVQDAIDRAERRTNRSAWASIADDGVNLLTAHFLIMDARNAVGSTVATTSPTLRGAMTSEAIGPLSRSFASVGGSSVSSSAFDSWLALTGFGQEYLALRSGVFADRVL